jgi:hypothetical protein
MGYLDEIARRRIAALLLIAGLVVAGLAVADLGPFADPPTQEERARDTVVRFFDAAGDGDFGTVCDLLTKEKREDIEARASRVVFEQDIAGCAGVLEAVGGEQLGETRIDAIDDVRVSGSLAAVDAELVFPGAKRPEPRTFSLVLVDGDWKVSDFDL